MNIDEDLTRVSEVVCSYFEVKQEDVMRKDIHRNVSTARAFIIHILHHKYGYSAGKLSLRFRCSPRTIFKCCMNISKHYDIYNDVRYDYDVIMTQIEKEG